MAESFIHKNLADKRKEIQAYIGSLERDLEQARRDLSAIVATERVFQSKGPKVTAYMELAALFPRHELPKLCGAAMTATSPISTKDIAAYVITEKKLPAIWTKVEDEMATRIASCRIRRVRLVGD